MVLGGGACGEVAINDYRAGIHQREGAANETTGWLSCFFVVKKGMTALIMSVNFSLRASEGCASHLASIWVDEKEHQVRAKITAVRL